MNSKELNAFVLALESRVNGMEIAFTQRLDNAAAIVRLQRQQIAFLNDQLVAMQAKQPVAHVREVQKDWWPIARTQLIREGMADDRGWVDGDLIKARVEELKNGKPLTPRTEPEQPAVPTVVAEEEDEIAF